MSWDASNRRQYLRGLAAAGAVGIAGCSSEPGSDATDGDTGTLATQVSDQPGDIGDFDSCVVTVVGYWLGETDDESDTTDETETYNEDGTTDGSETDDSTDTTDGSETDDSTDTTDGSETDDNTDTTDSDDETDGEASDGREYVALSEPAEADLVELQGDETQLIDSADLGVGSYEFLQLDTDGVNATLADGGDAEVMVPGNAPLKFNQAFEIRSDTRTVFTADFTPVKRGRTDSYLLQPVASETTVNYETVTES